MGQTTATMREWHGELGWGVLDSPETPGGPALLLQPRVSNVHNRNN
ncbi:MULTISPECIES: hypothetical protein [Rhodococcus]|uniref:Uncharacterized protein n=1 Tax=Rhodococcus erythropolis TaxID=1833 RepID=A0A8I1DCH1_RHOER|nr:MULTISPECIES: hypothetical protein [Rhodococcus]MBH5147948.1 hypothetical protein [Rhodococcus erythropolis]